MIASLFVAYDGADKGEAYYLANLKEFDSDYVGVVVAVGSFYPSPRRSYSVTNS